MSDRELLEAAAKAAGTTLIWDHYAGDGENGALVDAEGYVWSPLTDDGDALRLAVKLSLTIEFQKPYGVAACGKGVTSGYVSNLDSDPYTATRRAIVRAAAALAGKETP